MVKWLNAKGVSLDVESDDGHTPRTIAEEFEHKELLAWLTEQASKPPPPPPLPPQPPKQYFVAVDSSVPVQQSQIPQRPSKPSAKRAPQQSPQAAFQPSQLSPPPQLHQQEPEQAEPTPLTKSASWLPKVDMFGISGGGSKPFEPAPAASNTVTRPTPITWFGIQLPVCAPCANIRKETPAGGQRPFAQ